MPVLSSGGRINRVGQTTAVAHAGMIRLVIWADCSVRMFGYHGNILKVLELYGSSSSVLEVEYFEVSWQWESGARWTWERVSRPSRTVLSRNGVEFSWKGALDIGRRLGGLGPMPGWVMVAALSVASLIL